MSINGKYASAAPVVVMLAFLTVAIVAAFLIVSTLVQHVSGETEEITQPGAGDGQTLGPEGLGVDFEVGRLFVADTKNNRVQIFDAAGDFQKKLGELGEGKGQFNQPTSIAVDNDLGGLGSTSKGSVYVVDQGNFRIQKFTAAGNFVLMVGKGVNKTTGGNICTQASGNLCGKGTAGPGEGEFSGPIYVAVGPSGTIYVVDSDSKYRLQKLNPDGTMAAPQKDLAPPGCTGTTGLAVDSKGDFYVSCFGIHGFFKYDAAGNQIKEVKEASEGQGDVLGLAVNEQDHLYAGLNVGAKTASIIEFDPAVNRVRRFGYGVLRPSSGRFRSLAPTPGKPPVGIYAAEDDGNLAGTEGNRVLRLTIPPKGPLAFPEGCTPSSLGNQDVTLAAEVNPEGKATTFHFEYVTQEQFESGGFTAATKTSESASIGSDFKLHSASAEADVVPETQYRCRVIAKNTDGETIGEEGEFTTLDPLKILDTWTFGVETDEATLTAEVNPLGIPATGFFEYVDEATYQADVKAAEDDGKSPEEAAEAGFDHAQQSAGVDFGGGEDPEIASAVVSGLAPGTTYRYRVIATDTLIQPKTIPGPTVAFRTYAPPLDPDEDTCPQASLRKEQGSTYLPDCRAHELVSPAQKNSAEVVVPEAAGGLFNEGRSVRIQAGATSGEAVTYTSWTSFGEAEGAPSSSQYLSKRTASGWGTENISPFGFNSDPLEVPYRGFTKELTFAGLFQSEPSLAPGAQPGFDNLYLRNNDTGALQALTDEPIDPEPGERFCVGYAGASADGKRAIFAANAKIGTEATKGKGFSLYEWSETEGLKLASVLPNGSPAPPFETTPENRGTGFGAAGGTCTMGQARARNAISEDGSTIFWTYGGEFAGAQQPLFARIHGETTETVQLDAKVVKAAAGPPGGGVFEAASSDGSRVIFTAPGRLTTNAQASGPHLYRYNTETRTLTNLIPGTVAPKIQGVIGASEDGAYVYFVAAGVLSEEENDAGQKAKAGASNLYLWHEDEGGAKEVRFVATLEGALDGKDWSPIPTWFEGQTARVSPDGRHLAFLTVEAEALSDFSTKVIGPPGKAPPAGCQPTRVENKLQGDPRCAQAYIYDADADALACASCGPAGSRPLGPAALPSWANPYEGPRYLSEDGGRLFFESRDSLSAADQNGKRDIYEYEVEGAGGCSASSPDFAAASGGCVSLVSDGKSEDEAYLFDGSSSGRDVFFTTRSRLTGWDQNENYDVYDAREGGGFPQPPTPPPICEPEACKPPPTAPPPAAPEATSTLFGTGNPPPKKPKPGKQGKKNHGKKKQQGKGKGKKQGKRRRHSRGKGRAAR